MSIILFLAHPVDGMIYQPFPVPGDTGTSPFSSINTLSARAFPLLLIHITSIRKGGRKIESEQGA
jgi:hypothetical protein